MKKIESGRNTPFSAILGLIPRIHAKHSSLDTRDKPEYDADLMVNTRVTPEYDHNNLRPQCAPDTTGFLSDVYKKEYTSAKISSRHQLNEFSLGRSMIEMLGVLAIIGVLSVGGIAGYSKAMMQFRINQTKQEISEIITNVRTLYAQQKDFNGLDNLPKEIIVDKKYDDGWNQITTPFRGRIWVEANLDFSHVANSYGKYENFNVQVVSLSKEVCIALATSDWGSISSTGVAGIAVGAVSPFGIHQDILKNCNSQGETSYYTGGYYACSGQRISPAIAAQYCKDNSYNNFILTIVK